MNWVLSQELPLTFEAPRGRLGGMDANDCAGTVCQTYFSCLMTDS
ncbi:MAG: hypothetical protein CEO21_267 [Microgenomates group bacterium Gr01-1014_80]|nr:MAG: hypothetical protein CEO21_267 [Microgenomates group bacterium Gr01-1014_80]